MNTMARKLYEEALILNVAKKSDWVTDAVVEKLIKRLEIPDNDQNFQIVFNSLNSGMFYDLMLEDLEVANG